MREKKGGASWSLNDTALTLQGKKTGKVLSTGDQAYYIFQPNVRSGLFGVENQGSHELKPGGPSVLK
jgi:hypothetical protein